MVQWCLSNNIVLLVTIDKFDFNIVSVNINKLKPYRFVKDHTLQPFLNKPNDFLLKEPMEITHFHNMFIEELIKVTHSKNMFNEELVETNHSSDLFIEKLAQLNTRVLIVDNLTESIVCLIKNWLKHVEKIIG